MTESVVETITHEADHSACGVGFIAREDGIPTHETLQKGLEALRRVEHRGGVAADGRTSDGAGILIDLDQDFFKTRYRRRGKPDTFNDPDRRIAVGAFYMPRDNKRAHDRCWDIINEELHAFGYYEDSRDRESPMRSDFLGEIAERSHPRIYHLFIPQPEGVSSAQFERDLYFLRRKIENRVEAEKLSGEGSESFYIPSMSSRTIVYKGLPIAGDMADFYTDLKDPNYKTSSVIFHRRFSTNTAPAWQRAHPYRTLAHNGEINSLPTNINMIGRIEQVFSALYPEENVKDIFPILQSGGTDSAMLDNAVEFLIHAGLSPAAVKMLLVPEAVQPGAELSDDVRQAYEFIELLLGPWDGPNTMIIRGDHEITVGGDRSGLRPVRYYKTEDGYVVAGSEDGMIDGMALEKGNLKPGDMLSMNFREGRVIYAAELKERAAAELEKFFGYRDILANVKPFVRKPALEKDYIYAAPESLTELRLRQRMGNITQETAEFLEAMVDGHKEPLGSMGDDTPAAITSAAYRTLASFFQQRFAQVTNPPLDSIRERAVMSLKTPIGFPFGKDGRKNNKPIIMLDSPILTNSDYRDLRKKIGEADVVEINCRFDISGDEDQLQFALDRAKAEAEAAARARKHIVLTDEHMDEENTPIPMLLAAGAINTHLLKLNLRSQISINVRSSEAFASHDFAALIGLGGADTVNAYMAEETIAAQHRLKVHKFKDGFSAFGAKTPLEQFLKLYPATGNEHANSVNSKLLSDLWAQKSVSGFLGEHADLTLGELAVHENPEVQEQFIAIMNDLGVSVQELFAGQSVAHSINNWKEAAESGLLKIMAKMGVAHVSSYRGGRMFEALGIAQDVIDQCFTGVKSPVGGLNLSLIQERTVRHHQETYKHDLTAPLEHLGRYKFRSGENTEPHILTAEAIEIFQSAVKSSDFNSGYALYKQYRDIIQERSERYRFAPRDWMDLKGERASIDIADVEPAEAIMKRFFTGAMSDGSLGTEAHETLAVAMNRIGGKSNSGEGGEHPNRYGTERRSKMKQVASGRFGMDLDYLLDADILQIKVAQGAKPGEGGELPGGKVEARIAFLRKCEEGTTLISPAPHHDIYSIEDLEQLIYDLKQINPRARVDVKLVSSTGVEVIAPGVAKAGADSIHIGGANGSTGASPQLSMPHAGMPWEISVNRVHQALINEGFRGRVTLTTDGGMRTGRDIVVAALMGAEEYGYGLQALIAEGCKLVRSCQNNDCPFGIATTDEELRKKFIGTPEMVENMMRFIAQDVRETLAQIGLRSLDEAIGRADLLEQSWGRDLGIGLDGIFPGWTAKKTTQKCELAEGARNERVDPQNPGRITVDMAILEAEEDRILGRLLQNQSYAYSGKVTNEDRTVGGRMSGILRKIFTGKFGFSFQLPEDSVVLNFKGIAGQSLGAALMGGMTINLEGGANDGVGKALSGGKIIVKPDTKSPIHHNPQDHVIVGNSVLYSAKKGQLYAAGRAGNRFAILLSGATAVVEGAGANACNYMISGTAVILGDVGMDFGAGMSGGEVFVYDRNDTLAQRAHENVKNKIRRIEDEKTESRLKGFVQEHFNATGSVHTKSLLADWTKAVGYFKVVRGKNLQEPVPA